MDPLTIGMIGGSLLKGVGGLFGANSAEDKLNRSLKRSRAEYGAGVNEATAGVNTSSSRASRMFQPYARAGGRANTQYGDAIGVNGRPAQQRFFSSWVDDPGFQATQEAGRQQIEHSNIVRGTANSGAAMKELFDFGQRSKYGQFQDRLDRLQGLSTQGLNATTGQVNIERDRGSRIADLVMDRTRFMTGNTQNRGQVGADAARSRWDMIGGMAGDMVSSFGQGAGRRGY